MGQNVVVRGGIVRTRPGSRTLFCLPDGNFQGCTLFTPQNGVAQLVFAVDGAIYVSSAPFSSYRRLRNLQFSNISKFVAWSVALKSTDFDVNGQPIALTNPYSVLMIQDGLTRAGYWDGSNSGHLNPSSPSDVTDASDVTDSFAVGYNQTPIGLWMIWSGNRLWVSRGNQIFASDIGNPLSFTESLYINEGRAFYLSGPCTGMIEVPSGNGEDKGFIAFTENDGTLFQSYIQDRLQWLSTPLFQNTILPNVGCVAPRSLVTQYGLNWWFSARGLTNMNAAFRQNLSSRIDYQDNQMMSSKAYIGPDLSGVCGTFYENYMMMSVPFADIYNRHTWVLDQAPFDGNVNAWTGFWTGWRPIEWCRGLINGDERVFFGSVDYDGKNRIWEGMLSERKDNGCRITCYAQLRDHSAGNLDRKRYEWTKFFLTEIYGDVDLNVYMASGKGGYQLQKEYRMVATEGQIFSDTEYSERGPLLMGNRPQSRVIKTPSDPLDDECNSCGVESREGNKIDYAFSHLLVWSGNMGIRAYQMHMRQEPERNAGDCEEDEVGPRTLNAQGCSGLEWLVNTVVFKEYTATAKRSARLPNGYRVALERTAVSVISQRNAYEQAQCAVDMAEAYYYSNDVTDCPGVVPPPTPNPNPPVPPVKNRLLVVAGGGGGGRYYGGGGGGGGVYEDNDYNLTNTSHSVVVGNGGAASPSTGVGSTGGNSSFDSIVMRGGGGGGGSSSGGSAGLSGGCGGGGGGNGIGAGGIGLDNFNGGTNQGNGGGAGGGGASEAGYTDFDPRGGDGGEGISSDISGVAVVYGSGGGGSASLIGNGGTNAGNGASDSVVASAPVANLGGGGGGGSNPRAASAGAAGVVIIRYGGTQRFTGGSITSVGGDTVHTFTSSGSLTPL